MAKFLYSILCLSLIIDNKRYRRSIMIVAVIVADIGPLWQESICLPALGHIKLFLKTICN